MFHVTQPPDPNRGYVWGVYITDSGTNYSRRVNKALVQQPERGWQYPALPGLSPVPRQSRLRRVVALDDQGAKRYAVIPDVNADLWTGVNQILQILANDGTLILCNVIGRIQEKIELS